MLISATNFSISRGGHAVLKSADFELTRGTIMAVTGPSGSGKTSLLEALAGKLYHGGTLCKADGVQVAFVPQQHQFRNLAHTDTFYYQQRFNSFDADDSITVAGELPALFAQEANADVVHIRDLFGMELLRERRLLHLSNGENKRLQLARALLGSPSVLLLDNPFAGLDAGSRQMLEQCLLQLAHQGLAMLLSCAETKVPLFVHQVLTLDGRGASRLYPRSAYRPAVLNSIPVTDDNLLQKLMPMQHYLPFTYAVRMYNVQVRYGGKQVLHNINWEVKKGTQWSLSGPNGAGKSTLLSLITADNPQAYANELYLFDKKRGSGESIWDIKKNIGYVSPELHLNFDKSATVFEAVGSGYFDTIGLFRQLSAAQSESIKLWLQLLHLQPVAHKRMWQLPLGTQRLVLLARALIKNPALLVLDEPLQGLDEHQSAQFRAIIDAICSHNNQTLIFVSHYPEDLPEAVTHYLRLEEGTVTSEV